MATFAHGPLFDEYDAVFGGLPVDGAAARAKEGVFRSTQRGERGRQYRSILDLPVRVCSGARPTPEQNGKEHATARTLTEAGVAATAVAAIVKRSRDRVRRRNSR